MNLLGALTNKKYNPYLIFCAVLGVYLPIQIVILLFTGDDSTLSLAVVPVLFSGWFLGPWWAAGTGGSVTLCFLLFRFFSSGLDAWVDMAIGGGSSIIFTLIGVAIGRVEELNRLLKQELDARKIAEQELQLRTQQLGRSNKELEQFAYIASHDLQEPLRKISAFGSRLSAKYEGILGEQGVDYLHRMQNAAIRMQSLISGLLAYSRITTKAQPFSMVDLSTIANEVLGDLETKIKETNGAVHCDINAVIDAEPLQMRQLFQNLIGNALKYHAPDVAPQVTVRAAVEGGNCTITVSDNGIGFEPQYAEQIFGVFQRLHGRSSEYEGSGIGLSVCRKILDRHSGTITAQSELGKGATFTAVLPAKQEKQQQS